MDASLKTVKAETVDESVAKHFTDGKAVWKEQYDELVKKIKRFGSDISVSPTDDHISILRKDKEFVIIQVAAERLDIGIQLKNVSASGRFKEAGSWNEGVTHRVQITDPEQMDEELTSWLHQAYERIK